MHLFASIPSPPSNAIHLGPLQLRAYGLMIALGVIAAVYWAERRWKARGGRPSDISAIALWAVPAGILGARLYHVVTDYELYTPTTRGAPRAIWDGGLGIPGGIAAGVIAGYVVARRRHLPIPPLLDTVAPVLPLAQAIGRWGNWFNQELYGRPTSLPWGRPHRPRPPTPGLEHIATYQPDLPVRVAVEPGPRRPHPPRRTQPSTPPRTSVRGLRRRVRARPVLHRTDADRLRPHHRRPATQRMGQHRALRRRHDRDRYRPKPRTPQLQS